MTCTCMYYSLHQTSWPLGNQLTCPVVNVYSANFSVRSITYLEKKIGLIIINKIITFAVVLVLICKRYYLSELWKFYQWMHIDDFTKNSTENLFEFWVHIIHGTSLHFTPNFGGAYYTKLHITHKPVHAVPIYSMFYYFCYLLLQLVFGRDNSVLFQTDHSSKLYLHTI